ncbi:ATP binding [Ascochyta rabiei]|uniref:ATP binding n=2 Tax=Didymella rabiei TaxID=5454 RepID=A0A163GSE9_DIDRA|nr:ATP binding [Ascochyta rabiei]
MLLPPLDITTYPTFTMSRGICASRPPRPSSTVSSRSSSSSSSTSPRACAASPDFMNIQKLIRAVFRSPKTIVEQTERLQSQLQQVFLAKLTDDTLLVLRCPPAVNTRLLRHEKNTLETEVKTLEMLYECTQLPVPQIIKYDSHGGQFGSPFVVTNHISGRKLSELSKDLTTTERSAIDRSLGFYVRRLTSLSAKQFGTTHQVFDQKGCKSWREAFLALLEAALRDAEDMLVTIPYDSIRYYISKHSHILDEVAEPRLVALNVCKPENVLVHEHTKHVTGLLGFSNVIWGDALMSGGVANGSDAFFEGFGECPMATDGAKIRILIYTVYRSILEIAAHHYRPNTNVDELEARRELVRALNDLART